MSQLKDVLIGLPVGIVYSIFVNKGTDVLFEDEDSHSRFQKSIVMIFIAGILGIVLAQTVFSKSALKNKSIKFGLIFGSLILFAHSLITNWSKLEDYTKLIIISIIFGLVVWFAYYEGKDKDKDKEKEKDKNK